MLKKDELYTKPVDSLKGRNLFNPPPMVKAVLGWLNYNLLSVAKTMFPEFISGMNME